MVSNASATVATVATVASAEAEQANRSAPYVSTARRDGPGNGRGQAAPLVLVADDQPAIRKTLRRYLESAGYKVIEASSGRQAVALMSESVAVALLDLYMPDVSGIDCIGHIRKQFADAQVIVTSTSDDIQGGITALRHGAFQYLTKPLNREELLAQLHQAVQASRLARENHCLRQAICYPTTSVQPVGNSPAMRALRKQIEAFARLDSTVLITGASGTGKTNLAAWIHHHGPRASRPLVGVHCSSVPRDLIETELFGHVRGAFADATSERPGQAEIAHGGTLLLDEVGDLPMETQEAVVNFLQDRTVRRLGANAISRVDVRVIATAGRDLAQMCRQGEFREDLYFRLNVLSVPLPTLRDRSEDLAELAHDILTRFSRRFGGPAPRLTDDAVQTLRRHDWPGNVRELEDVLQRASAFCEGSIIRPKDIVIHRRGSATAMEEADRIGLAGMTMAEIERCAVIETIRSTGGNKAKAARQLEVSEKTIYNKIKQYNLTGKI